MGSEQGFNENFPMFFLRSLTYSRKCQNVAQLRMGYNMMTNSREKHWDTIGIQLEHDDMMQSDMILRARKCRSVA